MDLFGGLSSNCDGYLVNLFVMWWLSDPRAACLSPGPLSSSARRLSPANSVSACCPSSSGTAAPTAANRGNNTCKYQTWRSSLTHRPAQTFDRLLHNSRSNILTESDSNTNKRIYSLRQSKTSWADFPLAFNWWISWERNLNAVGCQKKSRSRLGVVYWSNVSIAASRMDSTVPN